MRISVDLPDDLLPQVLSIAGDTSQTLSETVVDLLRRGVGQRMSTVGSRSQRTGLPVVSLGIAITIDDVRSLQDDA